MEEKRRAGIALLDLTVTNPTQVLPDYPHGRIAQAFGRLQNFNYNPDPFGSLEARNEIVRLYAQRQVTLTPDRIALTASSSEAYALLFKLLCDPDDEVLVPAPSYPLFEYLAALESVRVRPYRLAYDGSWCLEFAALRSSITSRTRAIVVVNPNNPTGSFLKRTEAQRLIEFAREWQLPIVSDEVFMDYAFHDDPHRVETLASEDGVLTFCLNGLSKMAAMPQMKLGWIVISGCEAERQTTRERLELVLDTYLSVNVPVQAALSDLILIGDDNRRALKHSIQANRRTLAELLRGSPIHALHADGGWSAILRLPNVDSEESWIAKLINDAGILAQPGYFFDMGSEPHVIVSLITQPDVFAEGISRMVTCL